MILLALGACGLDFNEPRLIKLAPGKDEPVGFGTWVAIVGTGGRSAVRIDGNREGELMDGWLVDLLGEDDPEFVVWFRGVVGQRFGTVQVYSTEGSLRRLAIAQLSAEQRAGYRGQDTFSVEDGMLLREYPWYLEDDKDDNPTGGTAKLRYSFADRAWVAG
ncbi:hypothetical protein IIA16_01615 [bacterium]|nr:hypothetical protein [bacterium]